MKKLLATIVGAVVGFVVMQAVTRGVLDQYFGGKSGRPPSIEAMIASSPAEPMYEALKSYFPEDAKLFRDSMEKMLADGVSAEEGSQKMMSVGAEIRRRHAPKLKTAPDASLVAVIEAQLQLLKHFENDPALCNQVFMYGPVAIPKEQQEKLIDTVKLSAAILFRAMHEGDAFPVNRGAATDQDWGKLMEVFLSSGGTEEEIAPISDPNVQDPALCGAGLRFLRAASFAEFEGADRARAEIAYLIIGG